jgi:hypothetical protein
VNALLPQAGKSAHVDHAYHQQDRGSGDQDHRLQYLFEENSEIKSCIHGQAELNHKNVARVGAVVPVYMTARRPPITLAMTKSGV